MLWHTVSPDRIRIPLPQFAPDAVAELAIVVIAEIAGDGVPVEELRVVGAVGAAGEGVGEDALGASVRGGTAGLEMPMRFTKREEIEEVGGG